MIRKDSIRQNLLFLIFISSLTITTVFGQEPDQLFKSAGEAYTSGDFKRAVETYKQILAQGYEAEDLYFNLGNAYYKSGEIPSAILFYEKALKLNPGNEDARFNLQLANQKTVDKIEPLPELAITAFWRKIVFSRKVDSWGWLTIQVLFLSFLFFAAYVLVNNILLKKIGFFGGLALFCTSILFFMLGYQQKRMMNLNNHAIIYSSSLTARSAPDQSGTKLFVVHEGTKVQLLDSLSEWKKISIPNGSIGWVKSEALEKI